MNSECCSESCDTSIGRCGYDAGDCKPVDAGCTNSAECCTLSCDPTTMTCVVPPCEDAGALCFEGTMCCSGVCDSQFRCQ
jgi:hypothetical protein